MSALGQHPWDKSRLQMGGQTLEWRSAGTAASSFRYESLVGVLGYFAC